jgi:hypothetical protein
MTHVIDLHDEALVTVAEAEHYLNLEGGYDNQRVKLLINAVSFAIQNYTERKFTPEVSCVDTYLHFDAAEADYQIIKCLVTEWTPLTTLTSITFDGVTYASETATDAYTGLIYLSVPVMTFKEFIPVVITYKAGYSETPIDIKQVALDTIGYYYKRDFLEYASDIVEKGGRPDEVFFPESCRKVIRDYTRDML